VPWRNMSPTDQRLQLVADYHRGLRSMTALCADHGISRKIGYKWLQRYAEHGPAGLVDQSRRPRHCPHATTPLVMETLLELRRRHASWGPKKLLAVVARRYPDWALPSASTVGARFAREGLVTASPRRRPSVAEHPGMPTTAMSAPNAVWTIDFKGQFRVGGQYCYPLTVLDGCSRFLLGCDPLGTTTHAATASVLHRLFRTYGLPHVIRSDNGAPFAAPAIGRLARLSIWWIHLGIRPELIEPGHPQQNGRHERFHRTLKAETAQPPAATWADQTARFVRFRREYNTERPHEALAQQVPAACYAPSPRRLPRRLPPVDYPNPFEVRRVGPHGCFSWHQQYIHVGQVLSGEDIGFDEIDDGIWTVYFGPVRLGRLDERTMRVDRL